MFKRNNLTEVDLDNASVEELEQYIAAVKDEIPRLQRQLFMARHTNEIIDKTVEFSNWALTETNGELNWNQECTNHVMLLIEALSNFADLTRLTTDEVLAQAKVELENN